MGTFKRSGSRHFHHGTASTTTFLFDASGASLPDLIFSGRRERTAYVGPFGKIFNSSTDTVGIDIAFLPNGDVDLSAITAYCGSQEGRLGIHYDQGATATNWVCPTWANMPRIYGNSTGSWAPELKNGKLFVRCPSAVTPSFLVTPQFAAQTGNAVTACMVGQLTDGGTTPPPQYSPRYISLLPTNTALTDSDQTGAYLISRAGGAASHTQAWAIQRAGTTQVTTAGTYNSLQQVTSQISGTNYSLSVDGTVTTGTASLSNFNFSRVAFGYKGDAGMTSTDQGYSAVYVYFSTPTSASLQIVQSSMKTYWATATQSTGTVGRTNLPNFTLVYDEDFNTDCVEGQFLNVYGNRFYAYPTTGKTTHGKNAGTNDHYSPNIISVSNGALVGRMYRDMTVSPTACVAFAVFPKISSKWPYSSQLYGRYEYKMKVTSVVGWKVAPELWPDSNNWPHDGELDHPDMSLTGNIRGFYHYMNGTSQNDQDQFTMTPSTPLTDWHIMAIEWTPTRVDVFVDGNLVKHYGSRILSTPMHWIFQCENRDDSTQPVDNGPFAYVYLDYCSFWSYSP